MEQPPVTLERAYMEREVTHPQARMSTFFHVCRRSTPVLDEKERQSMACAGQVRMLGVQRKEHLIGCYSLVERIDEALKEGRATGLICSDSKIKTGRCINHGAYVRGLKRILILLFLPARDDVARAMLDEFV